jgi:hypothetical protein
MIGVVMFFAEFIATSTLGPENSVSWVAAEAKI